MAVTVVFVAESTVAAVEAAASKAAEVAEAERSILELHHTYGTAHSRSPRQDSAIDRTRIGKPCHVLHALADRSRPRALGPRGPHLARRSRMHQGASSPGRLLPARIAIERALEGGLPVGLIK